MRGRRIAFPNAVYHVLNRFVDKHPFFADDDDYGDFLDVFFDAAAGSCVIVHAYCLMPNHFHFCLETPDANISEFLRRFLTRACVRMNRKIGRTGHLFAGRTKTLLIDDAHYFNTVVAYVLLNPVRARMTPNPLAYRWSSAAEMLAPGPFCRIDRALLLKKITGRIRSESDERACCEDLVNWLSNICRIENERVFRENHRGAFLGSQEYRRRILDAVERRLVRQEGRFRRRPDVAAHLNWNDLNSAINGRLKPLDVTAGGWISAHAAARQIQIYIAHQFYNWSYDKIQREEGDAFGLSAYGMSVNRIRTSKVRRTIAERIGSVILSHRRNRDAAEM